MALAENHHSGLWEPVRRRPVLFGALALLVLSLLFFWKLSATSEYMWMDSPDLANQVLPWWNHQAREWHAGRFPAWEPDQWAGQPLIGQAQPGAAYPLNWLLFLTPLKDGKLRQGYLDYYWILIHYIAAFNAFLLCWDLRRSWLASILAGSVFGLLGYVGNVNWPQMVNGAIWAPLVLMFLIRAVRGRNWVLSAAASGFFLGLSWLAGHHQAPTFITYVMLVLWAYFFWQRKSIRLVIAVALFLAFFVGTSALQTLPSYEYAKQAKRWVGAREAVDWKTPVPYQVHGTYSMRPIQVLGLFVPNFSEGYTGFVGVTALTIGLCALWLWAREPWVRRFTWIAGAGIVVALGIYTPFHGWLYAWVPLFEKARSPAAAIVVFNLAFMVLVAYGLDAARRNWGTMQWPRWLLTGFGALMIVAYALTNLIKGNGSLGDDRGLVMAFICLLLAGLLYAVEQRRVSSVTFTLALLALIFTEGSNTSHFGYISKEVTRDDGSLPRTLLHDDIAEFLRTQGRVRVWVDDKAIPYNFGDFHGIPAWGGYLASLTTNILGVDANHAKMQSALGVTHYVGKEKMKPEQEEVFVGSSGLKVYKNPPVMPHAWSVRTVFPVRTGEEANGLLQGDLDLRTQAFSIGPAPKIALPGPKCGGDNVDFVESYGGFAKVNVKMSCEGLVVLGDIYFPGWKATIDDRPATVHEVNGMMRGVVVGPGEHTVKFAYQPWSVLAGGALTGLSCVSLLAIAWRTRQAPALKDELDEADVERVNEIP